jgi:hypothetical protein
VRRPSALCGLAAVAVLVIGVSSASAASTRAEYVSQADPICAKDLKDPGTRALKGFFADLNHERWEPAAKKLAKSIPPYVKMIDSLKALEPPAADAAGIHRWEQGLTKQVPLARRLVGALHGGSPGKIEKKNRALFSASTKTMRIVQGFGFSSCDQV